MIKASIDGAYTLKAQDFGYEVKAEVFTVYIPRLKAAASRPEVFSQADLSMVSFLSSDDPRRFSAFRYRDSSYASPVCQHR